MEAVLHVLNRARKANFRVTQYDVVKSLFLADVEHLTRYGRPITFDNYVAMKDGPVPSKTYDLLKEARDAVAEAGGALPWTRRWAPELGPGCYSFENPLREVDEDILSLSDMKALGNALMKVKALGFGGTRDHTHEHPAYKDAWREDAGRRSFPMDYGKLFEKPNADRAKELAFLSRHI
ncbi:Panacea domain-containing protein [Roseomonas sp. USHLN139]|uniref:Panacea domain-containing protein n=1 Tax=Roseomonas sp. USHLN139 TaxID=3081298 RepID=UPI003B019EBF